MTSIILILTSVIYATSGLNIISRQDWDARPSKTNQLLAVNPPTHVVIHHSTNDFQCTTSSQCKRVVKQIQTYHMDTNKWKDIGYNFLVGSDGNVYEGRGWNKWGAHSPSFNKKSIGICLIGDFTSNLPSQLQIDTAKSLIDYGVRNNLIDSKYKLVGHRQDTAKKTSCPGDRLYKEIQNWDHFSNSV